MTQSFIVDWPPGKNQLWRSFRGRNILSARARVWREVAGTQLMAQRVRPVTGAVKLTVELNSPTKRKYDLDGRLPALLDLIVQHGIIRDDNVDVVKAISVTEGQGFTGAKITIEPAAIEVVP
jgi:Holliday junction resolvase RusA-like endonuclease